MFTTQTLVLLGTMALVEDVLKTMATTVAATVALAGELIREREKERESVRRRGWKSEEKGREREEGGGGDESLFSE